VEETGEELQIEANTEEKASGIEGYRYWNGVNWKLIITQGEGGSLTWDKMFRTFHDQICNYGENDKGNSG
jgi:hypothetical protein